MGQTTDQSNLLVIVEDSVTFALLLKELLSELNVKIVVHKTLLSAAPDIRHASYAILDWSLGDGVTPAQSGVLELLSNQNTPFVVLTGSPEAVPSGLNVIDKQFVHEELLPMVKGWIRDRVVLTT